MSHKPGTLLRFTCCRCGAQELVTGGTSNFKCSDCTDKFGDRSTWNGKDNAGRAVALAIRRGDLQRPSNFACVDCGVVAQEYDHRDYNHPLKVEPVCKRCNRLRGPAIPVKGYFRKVFERESGHYTSSKRITQLFEAIGIDADLSHLSGYVDFEHWLPFKDVLLAWEAAA